MKISVTCFTAFLLAVFSGCINTGKVDRITTIPSMTDPSPGFMQHDTPPDDFLLNLFRNHPQYFDTILQNKDPFRVEVIYTQIDRAKKNKSKFTDYNFNSEHGHYFYPASTVKFPIAILALQKLNELHIAGLDKNTTMITGENGDGQTSVQNDPSAADGRPTIAHYIKKIFLVSDNDAFNRLYEFLGQEYINNNLHKMGFPNTEIIHRLSISLNEAQNRHTNPVKFVDPGGKVLYEQAAVKSKLVYIKRDTANGNYRMGKGFIRGEELVMEPFDFSKKNQVPLADLHQMTKSIMFPEVVPKQQQFNLTKEDYDFLRRYMSMQPGESVSPVYDSTYWDNYLKMIYYGIEKTKPEPGIRIFDKTGWSYGFLTETCYFADFNNNIEFILSATIHCNSDGIFNDDKYDYDKLGYPFMKQLGRVIYEYEKGRKKKRVPDLKEFKFDY